MKINSPFRIIQSLIGIYVKYASGIKTGLAAFAVLWMMPLRIANLSGIVILPLLWIFLKKEFEGGVNNDRDRYLALGLSGFFALCQLLGNLDFTQKFVVGVWDLAFYRILVYLGWWCIFYHLLEWIFLLFDTSDTSVSVYRYLTNKQIYVGTVVVCLVMWSFYLLVYYPGNGCPDSSGQFSQFFSGRYSNHHPIVHTMFLSLFYHLGRAICGNGTDGMAFCTIAQMCVMANIFAFSVYILHKYGVKEWVIGLIVAFYAFHPLNAMFVMWHSKDVIFAGIATLFVAYIWKIEGQKVIANKDLLMFAILGILFSMFRSNAYYAYILSAPFVIWRFRNAWKKYAIVVGVVIALVTIFNGIFLRSLRVRPPDIAENLSVPEQQIARVIVDGGKLQKDELELLNKVIAVDKIKGTYKKNISDPIKNLIRAKKNQQYIPEHKWEFLKLWAGIGIRYPKSYLYAWIDLTKGFWTLGNGQWGYSIGLHYKGVNMYKRFDVYERPVLGMQFREKISKFTRKDYDIPILSLGRNAAFYLWGLLLLIGLRIRKNESVLCMIPMVAVWVSLLLATPVVSFRYMHALTLSLPFYIAITWPSLKVRYEKNAENSSSNSLLQ